MMLSFFLVLKKRAERRQAPLRRSRARPEILHFVQDDNEIDNLSS